MTNKHFLSRSAERSTDRHVQWLLTKVCANILRAKRIHCKTLEFKIKSQNLFSNLNSQKLLFKTKRRLNLESFFRWLYLKFSLIFVLFCDRILNRLILHLLRNLLRLEPSLSAYIKLFDGVIDELILFLMVAKCFTISIKVDKSLASQWRHLILDHSFSRFSQQFGVIEDIDHTFLFSQLEVCIQTDVSTTSTAAVAKNQYLNYI